MPAHCESMDRPKLSAWPSRPWAGSLGLSILRRCRRPSRRISGSPCRPVPRTQAFEAPQCHNPYLLLRHQVFDVDPSHAGWLALWLHPFDRAPPRVGDPPAPDLDPASVTAESHALAVRSREPSATRSTICAVEKSCARKITSVQPSGEAASNSSAAAGLRGCAASFLPIRA